MQVCAHCGTTNRPGVIFCEQCGIALVPIPLATRQLIDDSLQSDTDELNTESVLILQIESSDAPITVKVRQEIFLGRVTEQEEGTTFINLTPYSAEDLGVSRQHARLLRRGQAMYLEDLQSTNGTKLNGDKIPANKEHRLHDGDEVMLGKLKLFIYFSAG